MNKLLMFGSQWKCIAIHLKTLCHTATSRHYVAKCAMVIMQDKHAARNFFLV